MNRQTFSKWLAGVLAGIYVFIIQHKYACVTAGLLLFLFSPFAFSAYQREMRVWAAGELVYQDMVVMEHATDAYLQDWLCVWIDAGHGGRDPGANYGAIYEKDITLSVSKKVASLLASHKVKVVMTREEDVYVDKYDRAMMANRQEADIFVSIHVDDLAQESYYGITGYYGPGRRDGKQLAQYLMNGVVKQTAVTDHGVHEKGYVVVKYTQMPSSLIEIGYMSNEGERKKLQSEAYQQMIAQGIADGILEYADEVMEKEEPR